MIGDSITRKIHHNYILNHPFKKAAFVWHDFKLSCVHCKKSRTVVISKLDLKLGVMAPGIFSLLRHSTYVFQSPTTTCLIYNFVIAFYHNYLLTAFSNTSRCVRKYYFILAHLTRFSYSLLSNHTFTVLHPSVSSVFKLILKGSHNSGS